jgi:SET domain-containing protein
MSLVEIIFQRLHQCNIALPKIRDDIEIKEVKGKGKGLFAKKDIKKNTLITLYPVHFIIKYNKDKDDEYALCDNLYDKDKYNNADDLEECIDYYLQVTKDYYIMGDPKHYKNMDLIGHFCNDKGYHPKKTYKPNLNNACLHNLRIISLKNIKAGEEITVAYGKDYWYSKHKNGFSHHDIIQNNYV